MRPASSRHVLVLFGFVALSTLLAGCPEKGAPPDKTTAEPERAEPDADEGKGEPKKAAAPTPAAAPAADDKKPDDDKDKGGW
jgi:hypothetical protein